MSTCMCTGAKKDERTEITFRFRLHLCQTLEIFGKRYVVEESPGIIELRIPCSLQIPHGHQHAVELFIPHESQ